MQFGDEVNGPCDYGYLDIHIHEDWPTPLEGGQSCEALTYFWKVWKFFSLIAYHRSIGITVRSEDATLDTGKADKYWSEPVNLYMFWVVSILKTVTTQIMTYLY